MRAREVIAEQRLAPSPRNSYIVGCKRQGVLCTKTSALSMVKIKFHPGMLHRIFAFDIEAAAEQTVDLVDLQSKAIFELEDSLYSAPSVRAIMDLLNEYLLKCVKTSEPLDKVDYAIRGRQQHHGNFAIFELAKAVEMGVRVCKNNSQNGWAFLPNPLRAYSDSRKSSTSSVNTSSAVTSVILQMI